MAESYIISIDQSTQGTKALLFDQDGMLFQRKDLPHKQIINEKGWVSHDPEEIYQNTVQVVKNLVEASGISKESVKGIGISNQRETSLVWEKETGKAIAHAVVWQCARAAEICRRVEKTGAAEMIRKKTGLALSPYFPASKLAWLKENVEGAEALAKKHALCFGTIDTWLVYRMTHGTSYKTDYSNASRTQLFDIFEQRWDEEICQLFGLDAQDLAEVCDSDSCFGETDLDGFFVKTSSDPECTGRFPWSTVWAGVSGKRNDQVHVWNRIIYYDEYRGDTGAEHARCSNFSCMGNAGENQLCAGRKYQLHGSSHYMAQG